MTKQEIIEMAEQAGFLFTEHGSPIGFTHSMLKDFAKLAAEDEREQCAKIAENRILHDENKNIKKGYLFAQQSIAQDIRSRGQE
jgi:hypothetical protein